MSKGRGKRGSEAEGPWGGSSGGGSYGSKTPDPRISEEDGIDTLIRKGQERFRDVLPEPSSKRGLLMIFMVMILVWLGSGVYTVAPEAEGVVLRFGEYNRSTQPGLRYHLPYPFEEVYTPQVTRIQRIEIGYRSHASRSGEVTEQPVPEESLMLTGDGNIIDITFNVQWKIKDAKEYLFNVRNPISTVKDVAESAMREVIGVRPLTSALTEGKQGIEDSIKVLIQHALDGYKAGIQIDRVTLLKADPPSAVIEAFRDVQAAKADQERMINEAQAYSNQILPTARGEAEKLLQDAEGYKAEITNRSLGDVARFLSVYEEYKMAKDVTRKRIYLETLEEVMQGMDKIIMDGKSPGVVPYMALPEIKKSAPQPEVKP